MTDHQKQRSDMSNWIWWETSINVIEIDKIDKIWQPAAEMD